MLKIENWDVVGWEHAIRGMRNPKNSWERSDSKGCNGCDCDCEYLTSYDMDICIGPNDLKLMEALRDGGPVHAKYRRMITVYIDITAPLYWWKEFDTYKVGTVANSCSTMHKIMDKEFTLDDFSTEHLISDWVSDENNESLYYWEQNPTHMSLFASPLDGLKIVIGLLNANRTAYMNAKKKPMKEEAKRAELMKKYWWQIIQLLPSSYNQKRTIMLNYEVLANIYKWRRDHKLDEWHVVCDWIENLPYSEIITGKRGEK